MSIFPTNYTENFSERMDKDGVLLLEHISSLPPRNQCFLTSFLYVALHEKGVLHVQYDLQNKELTERKVVILLPHHMLGDYWATDDFQRTLIVVAPRLLESLKHKASYRDHFLYHNEPECCLTDEQWQHLQSMVDVLRAILEMQSSNREDMLVNYLDLFFQLLNEYNTVNRGTSMHDQSQRSLFTRFYDLLIEHYKEAHDIAYYANAMCLTPKYFAYLIKASTGISASEWIDNYLIRQAKTLLRGYESLSIQQISNRLGFSEQSAFCRFFSHHTGMTPTAFRKTSYRL